MARVIHLALEVSGVLRTYSGIHHELLGVSLRRWVSVARLRDPLDHGRLEERLAALESRLAELRADLAALPEEELTTRARDDVRSALDHYATTLAEAIGKLRVICRRMGEAERTGAGQAGYDTEQLNLDRMAYDSAVQAYKRHGSRLNRLLSTY